LHRVLVVGNSGAGKTTVARAIASVLGAPHLELDAVRHRDGWDSVGPEEFEGIVAGFASADRWVIDGGYTSLGTREFVWPRMDAVVWLDPPRWLATARVLRRTLWRMITRERLWGSVTEAWSNLYSRDPLENIIVWTWTRHADVRRRYEHASIDGSWAHATVVRLKSRRDVSALLDSLGAHPSAQN
jgi:adenylate kinase family enzyme